MKRSTKMRPVRTLVLITVLTVLAGAAVFAQGPGGGGGWGGGGGRGGWGGPGGRGPRQASAATLQLSVLESALKLTSDQSDKIKKIQEQFKVDRKALRPPRPVEGGDPPDPDTMRANMEKMRDLDKKASDDIAAVLTDPQKKSLAALIKGMGDLQGVGIPPELYSDLKLTDAQKTKIGTIADTNRTAMRKVMDDAQASGDWGSIRTAMQKSRAQNNKLVAAVLTSKQIALIEKFKKDHPRPPFGGRGGRGGPGGPGGFGGPGDGRGAPPPPPPADAPPPPADGA